LIFLKINNQDQYNNNTLNDDLESIQGSDLIGTDDECILEISDILKNNCEILEEKEMAATLMALFFHLKLTQNAFHVISDLINFLSSSKVPNSFDKCAKILLKETGDQVEFKKRWFCSNCLKNVQLVNQYQRQCRDCKLKYYLIKILIIILSFFLLKVYLCTIICQ
jgi:hypothetical protein